MPDTNLDKCENRFVKWRQPIDKQLLPKAHCLECGNTNQDKIKWHGFNQARTARRFVCKECDKWGKAELGVSDKDTDYSFISNGNKAELTANTTKRIKTERDLVNAMEIDTNIWAIDKYQIAKKGGYRKPDADKGKGNAQVFLVEPVYSVKVWLKRKTLDIRLANLTTDTLRDMATFAPIYKRIAYPKHKDGLLYEVAIPDIHLGKMTWGEESGEDSDLKSQTKRVITVLTELLSHAKNYKIDRILLPIGNDFFNVDTLLNTTTLGTPQQEDTRWQKTFRAGRKLAVEMIDFCSAIAPVTVLQIPGNHDETRNFYLGDALEAWYHNSKDVTICNSARKRKYFRYGKVLLGFTHGNNEKFSQLPSIMALEEPKLWAGSLFREWHLGDKHHRVDLVQKTSEELGVTIRILRSLSPADAWHYNKGFVGALSAAESFLWSKEKGLVAQFTSIAK